MSMPVVAFDTLRFANRLKLVGVDSKQAEAEAEIFSEIFELNLRELVTKEDLKREISDLHKDMDARFTGIEAKFEAQRKDIDAKFAGIEAKFEAQHKDIDAKFAGIDAKIEAQHKGMDAKIEAQRKDIDAKFAGIDAKIEVKIEKLKFDLIKWVIGLLIAQSGLLFTILRLFSKTGV